MPALCQPYVVTGKAHVLGPEGGLVVQRGTGDASEADRNHFVGTTGALTNPNHSSCIYDL